MHYIIAGSVGPLVAFWMETMLYRYSKEVCQLMPGQSLPLVLEYGIGLVSLSAAVFCVLLSHYILDYYITLRIF